MGKHAGYAQNAAQNAYKHKKFRTHSKRSKSHEKNTENTEKARSYHTEIMQKTIAADIRNKQAK